MNEPEISDKVFVDFCGLIYEQAGIHLSPKKRSLVSSRLSKRMHALGIRDFGEYYNLVKEDPTQNELVQLLDAISTNVTYFFRESRHFDILRELLAKWEQEGQSRVRIWSAACSTGEEPFSMAMTAKSVMRSTADTRILATDLSTRVLALAKKGEYLEKRLEQVPQGMKARFFEKLRNRGEADYRVREELKRMVTFTRLNLSTPPFPMRGPLDVILCRNVMIYFDNEVRRRLLNEMYRLLKPGGYLMVGHAESLSGMLSEFKNVEPSVYIKQP